MKRIVYSRALEAFLSSAVVFAIAPYLWATPVLDQQYFNPPAGSYGSGSYEDNTFRRALAFAVGISGTLDHVDMRGEPGSAMRILATRNGVPTSTVIASSTRYSTTSDGWICWDMSSANLAVTPGVVLAMDMLNGKWDGVNLSPPTGDSDYFLNVKFGFPVFSVNIANRNFFRTFIDVAVPEPTSVDQLVYALAAMVFFQICLQAFKLKLPWFMATDNHSD